MQRNWKMILSLAFPSVLSFASVTVTGTISLLMIGQMGALAIAVVGMSNIIMYNAWALSSGIGHTINYLIAQNYGANEMKQGIERMYIAIYLSLALAALVLLAGCFAVGPLLLLISGSSELVVAGEPYLRFRFFAIIFSIMNFVFHGFFRGIGNTRAPMVLSFASNILMIFFTYTLTYGHLGFPKLGLSGAGLALMLGELAAWLGALYFYFISLNHRFHTRLRVKLRFDEARFLLAESGKLGMNEFTMSMAMFVFTSFVSRLGTNALAANEIALNVASLGMMPAFAFGATTTILVGQEIGRGAPLLARRMGTETAVLGMILLLLCGIAGFVWAEPIARMYSTDPAVFKVSAVLIQITAFLQLFDGLFNFYAGGLRGIGDTTFLLKMSLILSWVIFVPLSYLLMFVLNLGSYGAWISFYTFIIVGGITVLLRFYRTDWFSVRTKQSRNSGHALGG